MIRAGCLTAIAIALAGCPKGGTTPKQPAGDAYAGIFELQRSWTYSVTDSAAGEYEVSCQVVDQRDWPDGKVSMISCDGTFGEGLREAVAGMWASDARGVWYLPDRTVDDLADSTGMPRDGMTPEQMLLAATPADPCATQGGMKLCFADGGVTSGALDDGEGHTVTFTEAVETTEENP